MQDWWVRLRARALMRLMRRGYNEENHGDNGMLSVTCAWAVTHRIARGFAQCICDVCTYCWILVGAIAYQRMLLSPTFTEF